MIVASFQFFTWGTIEHATRELMSEKGPIEMSQIDPTQPTPEETDPAPKPEIVLAIESATGLVWADFKNRHPNQARGMEALLGDAPIVPAIIAVLQKGEQYQQLVAETQAETDVAGVIKGMAPIIMEGIRMLI